VVEKVVVLRVWMFSGLQIGIECLEMSSEVGRKRVLKRAECQGFLTVVWSDDVGMSENIPDQVRGGPSSISIQWHCHVCCPNGVAFTHVEYAHSACGDYES
jgi:hypothetical protein